MLNAEQELTIEQKFIQAMRSGNLEEVKKFIDNGEIGINTGYSGPIGDGIVLDGDTPLHIATFFGHLDIMEYLISKDANLSARCNFGNTPLANAIMANQLEAFKFLIARSNDQIIHAQNNLRETLLHMAAQDNRHEFIEVLIAKGANPIILYTFFRNSIIKKDFDTAKKLFSNLPLNDEVYKLIFFNSSSSLPMFYVMQQNDDLHKINNLLIEKVPSKFLCGDVPQNTGSNWPYIDFIFSFAQDCIPKLLETLAESGRDDIFIKEENIANLMSRIKNIETTGTPYYENEDFAAYSCSRNNADYENAEKAIAEHCKRNAVTGRYHIYHYLVPLKGCDDEFKQYFKDIYNVIKSRNLSEAKKDSEDSSKVKKCLADKFKQYFKDIYNAIKSKNLSEVEEGSEDLSKVEKSLKLITDALNANTHNINVDAVHEALILLVEKAELNKAGLNKDIIYSILKCQADITYPEEWKDPEEWQDGSPKPPNTPNTSSSTT
ncbi:MAG TPA: hypothetical protein DEQ74_02500, partial [Wolbachia sp.]|nr:hypothetical protein [Wolbachia sp.]